MKKILLFIFLFSVLFSSTNAQFAPQAGILGSTAIHKSNSILKQWAKFCVVNRGSLDVANPSLGFTSLGDSSSALNIADGEVVSLGDSGVATIQFDGKLYNGAGADFVVFENGFANPLNIEQAFLELAFVEVSSDGVHYFRFPSTSNTPNTKQIAGAGDYMDARLINNLAGKYVTQYGTPFDLEDLKNNTSLDVNNISHIRIVDAIGAINSNGCNDGFGNKINDPYPTPYPSGGFDLDAVAAINIHSTYIRESKEMNVSIYPNPTTGLVFVGFKNQLTANSFIVVRDIFGKIIVEKSATQNNSINLELLQNGIYFIGVKNNKSIQWLGKCSKI